MSDALTVEVDGDRLERLYEAASAMRQSPRDAALTLVEEGLRMREFPAVEFRDTALGRQAYLRGERLAVWQIVIVARSYDDDIDLIAEHFGIPADSITSALDYAAHYEGDITADIAGIDAAGERLASTLPPQQVIDV
ncbi:MAG TPA: hypothetical protein VMM78_00570 [Thermomicrobiales bacterium]|nr:hypothetical protein [Thermomicrobiales bacterium]